jgi:hypothetical protein
LLLPIGKTAVYSYNYGGVSLQACLLEQYARVLQECCCFTSTEVNNNIAAVAKTA